MIRRWFREWGYVPVLLLGAVLLLKIVGLAH
jgi:hypothetical protein